MFILSLSLDQIDDEYNTAYISLQLVKMTLLLFSDVLTNENKLLWDM